jgi:hypothetical protein
MRDDLALVSNLFHCGFVGRAHAGVSSSSRLRAEAAASKAPPVIFVVSVEALSIFASGYRIVFGDK